MTCYHLDIRTIGATGVAAIADFTAPRDDVAIATSARLASGFPHDVWQGDRLVHRCRQRQRLSPE